jgi:hypothetical protein
MAAASSGLELHYNTGSRGRITEWQSLAVKLVHHDGVVYINTKYLYYRPYQFTTDIPIALSITMFAILKKEANDLKLTKF